jgi:hypothetical protein
MYLEYSLNWKTTASKENAELGRDQAVIADILHRVYYCTYWDWNQGSILFFSWWSPEFQSRAHDGMKVYLQGKIPRYR